MTKPWLGNTALPQMTLKQLREALAKCDLPDDAPVKVWLPGSLIALRGVMSFQYKGAVCIEGNVEPGSALDG